MRRVGEPQSERRESWVPAGSDFIPAGSTPGLFPARPQAPRLSRVWSQLDIRGVPTALMVGVGRGTSRKQETGSLLYGFLGGALNLESEV